MTNDSSTTGLSKYIAKQSHFQLGKQDGAVAGNGSD